MAESSLILVVDDNETARYGKSRTLRRAGFEVIEAGTGEAALHLVEQRKPRMIVLDTQLPDTTGWEVCRRLKSNPETSSILVLQVSATYVREEDTVRALEGGADACLTEPIEPPVLVATVRALLRARRAEDALRDVLVREQEARAIAEAANRTKDEFLATLSHELRSPIGAILNWVTLLRSGGLDDTRTVQALEAIERNTRLQARLIEDLLDVSRIISGKMRLEMGVVDLAVVIGAAVEAVRPAANAKEIQLEIVATSPVSPILGDANRLQQIAWNLLSNAVKFTAKGGRVDVRVESVNSKAQISVTDSGKGIDPAFVPHVFERFRQADSSSTRAEGGLGLGLAIVRSLVELHGGTVEARSAGLGRGATFIVTLPLPAIRGPAQNARHLDGPSPGIVPPRSLDGARVIVVDDERDAREAITAVLEQSGAHVVAVASVRDGVEAVGRGVADLVISDIAMPGEDGYAFIREIRATPGSTHLPALALTAYGGIEEERRVLAAGYNGYLAKPVDPAQLVATVGMLARQVRR